MEIGSASLSGNVIVQIAPTATGSVTTKPVYVKAALTIFASTVSGGIVAWSNSATITAGQSNVLELVYQSGASTSSVTFTAPASTKLRAAELVLTHGAKAIELEDVEARVSELERAAEESKNRR